MRKFAVGVLLGILLSLAAAYLFLTQGGMPVAARGDPLPLERFLTSRALHVAIAKEAQRPAPIPADDRNLLAGARVYREHCAMCHGVPDRPQPSAVARGMYPRPPRLVPPGKGVTDDPVGETYWKVKNGIRLTGMPSFEGALTDEQLWQVSLLVSRADRLPETVSRSLR